MQCPSPLPLSLCPFRYSLQATMVTSLFLEKAIYVLTWVLSFCCFLCLEVSLPSHIHIFMYRGPHSFQATPKTTSQAKPSLNTLFKIPASTPPRSRTYTLPVLSQMCFFLYSIKPSLPSNTLGIFFFSGLFLLTKRQVPWRWHFVYFVYRCISVAQIRVAQLQHSWKSGRAKLLLWRPSCVLWNV